jgi:hypothetical protein
MSSDSARRAAVVAVLAELRMPAEAWQVITHARYWGAPVELVDWLHCLSPRLYHSKGEILAALERRAS